MSQMQDKYRSLLDHLPDGFALHQLVLDDEGNPVDYVFLDVNPAFEALAGLKRERLIGKKVAEVIAGIENSGFDWIGTYGEVALSGQSVRFEQYSKPLGRWYEVAAYCDEPGTFITLFSDITSRKQADQALRESEEKYRSLFERSLDAVCLVAAEGTLLEANPAYLKLYGYEPSDIGRLNVKEHYEEPSQREEFLRAVAQDGAVFDVAVRLKKKDGTPMECQRTSVAVRDEDGNLVAVQSVIRDVTKARRAEQELRESELRFRSLVENTGVAVLVARTDETILDCNDAALQMLGYPREELLKTPVPELFRRVEGRAAAPAQFERDGFIKALEVEMKRRDGSPLHVLLTSANVPLRGETVAMMEMQDITKRKRTEAALRESNERIRGYAAHLEKVREEERTGIARELHDRLGQALTAVKMDLTSMHDGLAKGQTVEPEKVAATIRLIDATTDDVRRISSELRPGILDDLGLVAAMEWQLQQFQERTGIRCELTAPDSPNLGRDRSTALYRIFQELLTNVARHAAAKTVRATFERDDSRYVLIVADDGKGMSEDAENQATSLGFVGIRERLASFGGALTVASAPGQGTQVTIAIPVDRRAPGSERTDRRRR